MEIFGSVLLNEGRLSIPGELAAKGYQLKAKVLFEGKPGTRLGLPGFLYHPVLFGLFYIAFAGIAGAI